MKNAMEMLEDFRKCASIRHEFPDGLPLMCGVRIDEYLSDVIRLLKDESASIERIVRDAICAYGENYSYALNDDCERELRERAEIANKWLVDHGFEPEKFTWRKDEVTCL